MSTDFSGETKHLHAKRLVHTAEWGGPPTESHAYIVEITGMCFMGIATKFI